MMTEKFEKRQMKKWFFYVDIIVVGIFALSLLLLVRDAWAAGFTDRFVIQNEVNTAYWLMMRDAAFLIGSLSWFFYRYFKNSVKVLQNPWT